MFIIKVMREGKNEDSFVIGGVRKYWLTDIIKCSYEEMKEILENSDYNIHFVDKFQSALSSCSICTYRIISLGLDNGEHYSILFDNQIFILNNEGKTIDKVSAW